MDFTVYDIFVSPFVKHCQPLIPTVAPTHGFRSNLDALNDKMSKISPTRLCKCKIMQRDGASQLIAVFQQDLPMQKSRGFTLIEIMIVVVIIGILAVVAFPSFRQILIRSDRSDARNGLLELQLAQERFRTTNGSYASAIDNLQTKLPKVGTTYFSERQLYQVQIDVGTVNRAGYSASVTAVTTTKQNLDAVAACKKIAILVSFTGVQKGHLDPVSGDFVQSTECW
jgi:type IV pilus assembly protein PilE